MWVFNFSEVLKNNYKLMSDKCSGLWDVSLLGSMNVEPLTCLQVMFSDGNEDGLWRWFSIGPQQGQARLPEVLMGAVDERVQTTVQVWHHWWQCPQPIRCRWQVHPAQQDQLVDQWRERNKDSLWVDKYVFSLWLLQPCACRYNSICVVSVSAHVTSDTIKGV